MFEHLALIQCKIITYSFLVGDQVQHVKYLIEMKCEMKEIRFELIINLSLISS
jgi:hypothetical protein